jgi:uncharacterized protein
MDPNVQDFVDHKRIAIVGVSLDPKKFGGGAYKELKQRGYQVYAIHNEMKEFEGEPCYPDLASVKDKVDGVFVCVSPKKGEQVLRDAASAGLRRVWLQPGAESAQLVKLAGELGLTAITGKCILMYAPPVRSVHGLHRTFVRVFGKL